MKGGPTLPCDAQKDRRRFVLARSHASENRGVILSLLVYGRLSIRLAQRETSEGKSGHWKVIGWRGRKKMNSGRPAGPCHNSRQCCMFYCVVSRREDGWRREGGKQPAGLTRMVAVRGNAVGCRIQEASAQYSTEYIYTQTVHHTHAPFVPRAVGQSAWA